MASILRNISWLTFGSAVSKPVWIFFVVVVCARVLGDEGYGVFTATLALAVIVRSLTDLGITSYSIREIARRRTHAARYLTNFLSLKTVLVILAVGGVLAAGRALGYTGSKFEALIFAACYTMALDLTDYCRAYYRAFERMKDEAFSILTEKGLVVALGLGFLLYYGTAAAVLGGMALGMLLTMLANVWWTTRQFAPIEPALLSRSFLTRALPAAIPFGLASQFVVIYFRTDAVMVDAMVNEAAAGQYGEAYRLLEAATIATGLVTAVIYPRLSSLFHENRASEFNRIFLLSAVGVGGLGLVVAIVLYLYATPLLFLIAGDATFAPAAEALKILAWAAPFMGINYVLSVTMNAADDQRLLAWILGTAALFNVAFNFVLIPQYSFLGASVATVATEVLITVALGVRYARLPQRIAPD